MNQRPTYAGIGSRRTPHDVLATMSKIARWLATEGWVCNTGGAQGADAAFAIGASPVYDIFSPWPRFNGLSGPRVHVTPQHYLKDCFDVARENHPAWHKCSSGAMKLHARNVRIVLGHDLKHPVEFVVCWTPEGNGGGGTGLGIRIARSYDIPVFDLARSDPRTVCLAARRIHSPRKSA